MIRYGVCIFALVVALAFGGTARATTLEFDGHQRLFEMYVPPTAPRPLPVVLVLHGGKSSAEQIRRYTGFDTVAARENILAVYPEGLHGQWNDGRPQIGSMNPDAADTDDVGFLVALVDNLADHGLADPKRVFVAGISNGGMMALHLACQHPERIAGVAVVGASQPADVDCDPAMPVPIVFFHGTDDRFVPYAGGDILQWANIDRGQVLSARDTVAMWRKIDDCSGQPKTQRLTDRTSPKGLAVDLVTFEPCAGAPVEHYIVRGGGHAWPGARQGPAGDALLGPASGSVDANEEIWSFFKKQPTR